MNVPRFIRRWFRAPYDGMRHYGTVEAVASAALWLASDECQWVTGHILNVDGGYGAAGLAYDPQEIR